MNKKEVLEIRKQFSPQNCAITRLCGCYVDGDKEKKLEFKEAFLSLPEEEAFKYFDLFKKTLSGTVGKNLAGLIKFIHIAVKKLWHETFPDFWVRNQGLIERIVLEAGV